MTAEQTPATATRPSARPRRGPTAALLLLTAAVAAAALVQWLLVIDDLPAVNAPFRLPLWALVPITAATSIFAVRLEFRRDTVEFSFNEVALVLCLFFADPGDALIGFSVGRSLGQWIADAIRHVRQPPVREVFDFVCTLLVVGIALAVFHYLAPVDNPVSTTGFLVALLALMLSDLARAGLIDVGMILAGAGLDPRRLVESLTFGLGVVVATTSLGLFAVLVLWRDAASVWVLVVPAVTVALVYHGATRDRRRQDSLQFLYDITRLLQYGKRPEDIAAVVLTKARDVFRAEWVELVLRPDGERAGMRMVAGEGQPPGRFEKLREVTVPARHREVEILPADHDVPGLEARLAATGVAQAMVAKLRGEAGVSGELVVAGRRTGAGPFDHQELQLLETLAYHTSVALENARLVVNLERSLGRLKHQATHDALTGLANRSLLLERANRAVARARWEGGSCAMLLLDLDGFKTVNDSLGHAAGDRLLVIVSRRISACLRDSDTAARLGGDEFVVLLDPVHSPEEPVAVAKRLIEVLREPIKLDGREVVASASVGVAMWNGQDDAEALLRDADAAMYEAKRGEAGRYAVFEPRMHLAAVERLELEGALRHALARDEFEIFYQPIVALQTGRTVALEALARWRRDGREIPAATFVPVAEATGLIVPIGMWVLESACRQLRQWQDELGPLAPVSVSVNLSPRQVQQADLVEQITEALRSSGLDGRYLELELTEGVLLEGDEETVAKLARLGEAGIRLAIDDFGSGYSSMSYLRHFAFDTLKIDGSFIDGLDQGGQQAALTRAMVHLGHALDLQVVAEGIERQSQLDLLRDLRCPLGQGHFLAPPMPPEKVPAHLAATRPRLAGTGIEA